MPLYVGNDGITAVGPSESELNRVQRELLAWQKHNFPKNSSWQSLLGVGEELGELNHAYLKRSQGIRGTEEEHIAKMRDAIGDIMVYLIDFANKVGEESGKKFNVEEILQETWQHVSSRDWVKFPKNGRTE